MEDHILRTTSNGIRAFIAITTGLVEEARRRHDCYPVAAAALGRTMTAALLLAATLKTEESITIRIQGDGPLGQVIADARANGDVRGYVDQPHVDLPLYNNKLAVGKAVGQGQIHVTRFTGLKDPFTGSVPLVSGEIAEDVANYLLVSEQTPSSVGLGVLVDTDLSVRAAGGFFIQALPDAPEESLKIVEQNIAALPPVSQLVDAGMNTTEILHQLFQGLTPNILDQIPVRFSCSCSRERVEKVLISLGQKELGELIAEGKAELTCHFCNDRYNFTQHDLQVLQALDNAK